MFTELRVFGCPPADAETIFGHPTGPWRFYRGPRRSGRRLDHRPGRRGEDGRDMHRLLSPL